jgi:hypothetical protein
MAATVDVVIGPLVQNINTTSFDWVIPSLVRVATNPPRTAGLDIKYSF